jgi:hypothetical protein
MMEDVEMLPVCASIQYDQIHQQHRHCVAVAVALAREWSVGRVPELPQMSGFCIVPR